MLKEDLKLPRYFQVQLRCFRNMGIDLIGEKRILSNYLLNLTVLAELWGFVAISHFVAAHIQIVDEFANALGPLWQMAISLVKWFTFLYKRREMVSFVKRILAWNREATDDELEFLIKENKSDIRFSRFYLVLVGSTGYFALVKPFLNGAFHYFVDGYFYMEPVVKALEPWDIDNPLGYFLHLLWISIGVHALIYISVGIDTLFSWITHNIIAQFSVLEWRLKQAAIEFDGYSSTKSIAACIEYHCRILDTVDELNAVFGFVMFIKFTVSCLQVCFLAYQFERVTNFGDAAFQLSFLIAVALQLILYCRNGQRIRDESLNIVNCVYLNFRWEKLSRASKKLLLTLMTRAQRECNLSGIFFTIDLSLYLWVFRTAGSYLALLTTLDEK